MATVVGILLVILLIGDPGRIDRDTPWLHWTSVALVAVLLASALGSTLLLVVDLLDDAPETKDAASLLLAGAKVWLTNNIAFALLYWTFDDGGPVQRAQGLPEHPDLAFPQQLNPELAKPGWRPEFLDYLYVAFTTANAFSPDRHDAAWPTGPRSPWRRRR